MPVLACRSELEVGNVYVYADVGRSGLANLLFPWARAEIFRAKHNLPMLAPQWTQLKIGPLLRGEKDLRLYMGLFSNDGYVRGLRKMLLLRRAERVPEAEAEAFLARNGSRAPKSTLLTFAWTLGVFPGWDVWFEPLIRHRDMVARRLYEMCTPTIRQLIEAQPVDYEIAVHVRRGDRPAAELGEPMTEHNWHKGHSEQWFVNTINEIRRALGRDAKVKLFSDAKPEQIPTLLAMKDVVLAPENPSIVDIFMLSKAKVVIATGTSSFSAWAVYLGGMPSLWYPGTAFRS
ncbi:MAG TPA: hypothetical protein VG797_06610, partial [Phycisphaerales bacterium]|nr:hypothetical protein [Phycisphaerales bacterium]